MSVARRGFLQLATGVVAWPALMGVAVAQAYPSRPVRLIVGAPAGGGNDIVARLIGQWLSERLGQQFVIDNRPGAGTNIGTETVVRSPPDGYTLLLVPSSAAVNATLYEKLSFNFIRDIAPVAGLIGVPNVMYVHPSFPANTVPEFIAHAKANPGKVNMASGGHGSSSHMAGELFKMMAAVNLTHVPYRGNAPAFSDLLGGQVHVNFATTPGTIDYAKTGRLRALAVTTTSPLEALPGVPPMAQFVPGYEASQWYGIGAPRGTPPDIIQLLNKEIVAGFADATMKSRLANVGGIATPMSAAEFGKLIAEETEKWGKVVKFAGIKAEN